MKMCTLFLAAGLTLAGLAPAGENLAKIYKGKLDYEEGALGRSWTSGPEDVWELTSFSYALKGQLELELGPSVVVFGKHEAKKTGKSVVWAALFPLDPAASAPIVAAHPGHGNHVKSIFLRFHPSLVGELFPAKTIVGQGNPKWSMWGKRIYANKINASWQAENMPVVPVQKSVVLDVETQGDRIGW